MFDAQGRLGIYKRRGTLLFLLCTYGDSDAKSVNGYYQNYQHGRSFG